MTVKLQSNVYVGPVNICRNFRYCGGNYFANEQKSCRYGDDIILIIAKYINLHQGLSTRIVKMEAAFSVTN